MRTRVAIKETAPAENQRIGTDYRLPGKSPDFRERNEAMDILVAEGGENLYNYVEWLGLAKDPNLIVLSSVHHYYFDNDDLQNVKAVINLKLLNNIKNISTFLHSIFQIIPAKSNFIGSFIGSKKQNDTSLKNRLSVNLSKNNLDPFDNGIISRIPFLNMVYNLMDSRTSNNISKSEATSLLEEHGFKVLDMTDLNGITYFLAQKIRVITE